MTQGKWLTKVKKEATWKETRNFFQLEYPLQTLQ